MSTFSLQICSRSPHLTRKQGPEWVAYKLAVDLIIINFYNPQTHQQAIMNSNNQRYSFTKKMEPQKQLPDQKLPALLRSPPPMTPELKMLMGAFTRSQVIHKDTYHVHIA
jgi:hypothetical protein